MSSLAKEVDDGLGKSGLSWWQRASLIVAANVVGLVLGAIVVSAMGIVWSKAMSTDDIKDQLDDHVKILRDEMNKSSSMAAAERRTIIDELAKIGAENIRLKDLIAASPAQNPDGSSEESQPLPEMSPNAVMDVKADLQKRIDEEVYRTKHLRSK